MPSVSIAIGVGVGAGGGIPLPQQSNLIRRWVSNAAYITEATDEISSWLDIVASHDATNTGVNGPDFIPGDPSVDFDDANSEELIEGSEDTEARITATGITAWAVVEGISAGGINQGAIFKWQTATSREWGLCIHNNTTGGPSFSARNSADTAGQHLGPASNIFDANKHLIIGGISGASGSATPSLWVDSAAKLTASSWTWRAGTGKLELGVAFTSGFTNGKIREVGLYKTALSDTDVAQLKASMNGLYGGGWT